MVPEENNEYARVAASSSTASIPCRRRQMQWKYYCDFSSKLFSFFFFFLFAHSPHAPIDPNRVYAWEWWCILALLSSMRCALAFGTLDRGVVFRVHTLSEVCVLFVYVVIKFRLNWWHRLVVWLTCAHSATSGVFQWHMYCAYMRRYSRPSASESPVCGQMQSDTWTDANKTEGIIDENNRRGWLPLRACWYYCCLCEPMCCWLWCLL